MLPIGYSKSRIDGIPTERSLGHFKKDSLEFRGGV